MPDRCQLLKQINEVSFVVNDLNLYLDKMCIRDRDRRM